MESYKGFVRRNAGLLSLIESGLSSLTWVLPERFDGGELGIEALHTALGLVGAFHDSIVSTQPGTHPPPAADMALALSTLEQVQVLLELVATRREERGGGSRYTALAGLEAVKAAVRLAVWRRSGSRILLHGGAGNLGSPAGKVPAMPPSSSPSEGRPQEVYGAFAAFRQRHCSSEQQQQQQQEHEGQQYVLSAGGTDIAGSKCRLLSGALAGGGAALRRAPLSQRAVAVAELLHILRPAAYALALRRWGRRSWKPWLLSLGLDLLSLRLGAAALAAQQGTSWFGAVQPANLGPSLALLRCLQQSRWAAEEERELAARRLRLLVYLLRDPLFGRYTQAALESWVRGTASVPLLGWLGGRAVEILLGVQRYYTYVERLAAS